MRTAGVEAFSSALMRSGAITFTFHRFAARYAVPVSWLRRFPADLYAGWRWKLRDDGWLQRGWPLFRGLALEDPRPACSVADRLSALGGQADLSPPSGQRALLPSGLPADVEERFSRWYVSRFVSRFVRQTPPRGDVSAGPTRFRDVPPDIWDHVVRAQMEEVLAATAGLLNKRAATTEDVVQVVHDGRVGELEWPHKDWTCAHASSGVRALFPLIHHGLRTAGYRYHHPLRQRELVGPDGDHIDVTNLAERVEQGASLPLHLHTALDADDESATG